MVNLITDAVKKAAKEKSSNMPLGTYSRLTVNNEILDIVISPTSSGVWFYHEPWAIAQDISNKVICFISYKNL